MGMMDKMMEFMTGRMSKEDKEQMMDKMMEKFFADMTIEDKKRIMSEITPQMMEGFDMAVIMPQMMMAMMGRGQGKDGMASTMPMGINITGKAKESNESPGQQEKGGEK